MLRAWPRLRIRDRPAPAPGPVVVSRVRTGLPLTSIRGIGDIGAAEVDEAGVGDLVALSCAATETVAGLHEVSDKRARRLITEPGRSVRAHGKRVIFPA